MARFKQSQIRGGYGKGFSGGDGQGLREGIWPELLAPEPGDLGSWFRP